MKKYLQIYNSSGEKLKQLDLPAKFSISASSVTLSSYINYIRTAKRQVIASTKDRGAVSGGGKKPWRQKGTGRARVGSSRSPLWIHGGVTFGPTSERRFSDKMSKKSRDHSRQAIFNHFADSNRLIIINKIELDDIKTVSAEKLIENLKLEGKIALFLSQDEIKFARAFRNLSYLFLNSKNYPDMLNVISCDWIVFSKSAFYDFWPKPKMTQGDK